MTNMTTNSPNPKTKRNIFWRLLPIFILLAIIVTVFIFGVDEALDLDRISSGYAAMEANVGSHPILAAMFAFALYAAVTALSFPAAWLLSVTIGLVFGWQAGSLIVATGATVGAAALFLIARYALADFFKAKAGGFLEKMAAGFRENSANYMLFLRLVPLFPFALVNVVPAILGVRFFTFLWTTAIGIIPGVIAYTYAGEGLSSIVKERAKACEAEIAPCGEALTAGDLVTKEILIAFFLLGLVAIIPVVLKAVRPKILDNNNDED